jgi:hypothetical protein
MLMAVGLAGVAVLTAVVVMLPGVEARFVFEAKVKAPVPPADDFWIRTDALVSVTTQVMFDP